MSSGNEEVLSDEDLLKQPALTGGEEKELSAKEQWGGMKKG